MQKLYAKVEGSGQPLLIIHGLLGSSDNWRTLGHQYAEELQVHLVDVRNHGKSFHHPQHDYPSLADDFIGYINDHQLQNVHLLGHSMGGKIAQVINQKIPQRITSLTVVDIALRAYSPTHDHIFAAMKALDLEEIDSRKDAENKLGQYFSDKTLVFFLLKNLGRNKEGYFWKCNHKVLHAEYQKIISDVYPNEKTWTPTLFVKGENSNYINESDHVDFDQWYENYELETISNAGHWVHAENPELFYEVSLKFLKKNK